MSSFQHTPLDLTKPSIRLLKLLEPSEDGQIRLSLRHTLLGESLQYTAVSYEWGDPKSQTFEVIINGGSFTVRQNLFDFLSSLSEQTMETRSSELWIDAICINQTCVAEKNHQVRQMEYIYQAAERVLIWLGLARDGSDQLLEVLATFPLPPRLESTASCLKAAQSGEQWSACISHLLNAEVEIWRAAACLANRSYWRRMWVLQEIFMGHRTDLLCGLKMITWEAWIIAMDLVAVRYSVNRPDTGGPKKFPATKIMRFWMAKLSDIDHYSSNLCRLVLSFGSNECAEIRDKVYALLGLASNVQHLTVSYECSVTQLVSSLLEFWPYMADDREHTKELRYLLNIFGLSSVQGIDCDTSEEVGHYDINLDHKGISPRYGAVRCCCNRCEEVDDILRKDSSNPHLKLRGLQEFSTAVTYCYVPGLGCRFFFRESEQGRRLYLGTGVLGIDTKVLLYHDAAAARFFEAATWYHFSGANICKRMPVTMPQLLNLLRHQDLCGQWHSLESLPAILAP